MKKSVLLLSFVFALGLFSVSANNSPKKGDNKVAAKTEVSAKSTAKAPVKKATHKAGKKTVKKVAAPSK
jgi:hypothetical protein